MKNFVFELIILLIGLFMGIFSMINLFAQWVPNIYPITGIILSLAAHILWSKYYGDKT
jgi:hypothetical protein